MFGGKMEMFILAAFDLSQSRKRSGRKNSTGDRGGRGSPRRRLGLPVGCGASPGPVASPQARRDEPEVWGGRAALGTVPHSHQAHERPRPSAARLEEPRWPGRGQAVWEKPHLQSLQGVFLSPFNSSVSGVSVWLPVGLFHTGTCACASLGRAPQSRAESSWAKRAISLDPLLISGSSHGKQGAPAEKLPSSTSPFRLLALAARQRSGNQQMSTPCFFQSPLRCSCLDALVGTTCFPLLGGFLGGGGSLVYSHCSHNKISEVPAADFSITGVDNIKGKGVWERQVFQNKTLRCAALSPSGALPSSPGEGSNLHGVQESSQPFVARLQPILISPTSQRQFWSRDPPRSQALSFCVQQRLLFSLSVHVPSPVNSRSPCN